MEPKTISLADDAYERLEAERREDESFSDVVRRLTSGVTLADYYGVLDGDTADELEAVVERRRSERTASRRERVEQLEEAIEE